jgi:hypothetical protein
MDNRVADRNDLIKERWQRRMNDDFNPGYTPETMPNAEMRIANAAEYAAYQLGQINRRLDQIVDVLGRMAAK